MNDQTPHNHFKPIGHAIHLVVLKCARRSHAAGLISDEELAMILSELARVGE